MAETIESFVEKLQQQGVEAGRAQAEKILQDAKARAETVVGDARKEADRILADAHRQARRALEQGRTELELAARDLFGRLRQRIAGAVEEVLRRSAAESLADEKFLSQVLHDVIVQYAQKDAEGDWPIEVRIDAEISEKVLDAALKAVAGRGGKGGKGKSRVDLKKDLQAAGFEYSVSGGVVEVTAESVAEALGEMIAPRLRELVDKAAAREDA